MMQYAVAGSSAQRAGAPYATVEQTSSPASVDDVIPATVPSDAKVAGRSPQPSIARITRCGPQVPSSTARSDGAERRQQ